MKEIVILQSHIGTCEFDLCFNIQFDSTTNSTDSRDLLSGAMVGQYDPH